MNNNYPLKTRTFFEKIGFWSLALTFFTISFHRFLSLYVLGFFLFTGFALWILDYHKLYNDFLKIWYVILPPVLYFFINLISIVLQYGSFSVIIKKLMFFLVPALGFPVFYSKYTRSKISLLFKVYALGILIVSIYLFIRLLLKVHTNYPGDIPVISWIFQHDQEYTSLGFSILEHPTYLALKINWLLILLFFVNNSKKFGSKSWIYLFLIVFLTVILYLLGSKSGLFLWIILVVAFLVNRMLKAHNPFFYIISIIVFLFVAGITVTEIPRVKRYISSIEPAIDSTQIDWKNLDQRTREWYAAIQLIKEKPVFGHGLAKVEDRMVEEYKKNGWEEEARLRFNAHNQFLEAQMTFGIPGTLSLIWMLITPVLVRKRLKYPKLAVAFTAMMSFFLLFESMFNRQWGIMFFILFYCILLSQFRENESETKNTI